MTTNRTRLIDLWHASYYSGINATNNAADEIINEPERHLLTQSEVFAAEGGVIGLAV